MRRTLPLGAILLGLLYLAALAVAAALIVQTLQLARSLPELRAAAVERAAATPTAADPQLEPVSYHPKTGRYIVAWLPPTFAGGAKESFLANADVIDDISPFWYSTDASGRLYGTRDDELVRIAHERNVRVIPSIHNVGNPGAVVPVLTDPSRRARHVQNIVDEVLARNYDGIDIDYESLSPALREEFSAFIVELSAALRQHDKLLTIAVHGKDSDYGGLGGFQDWAVIGQHVDQLRIMTYDYHWRGSGPGPVAPAYWINSVAEYARSVVDPSKVFIGVHFYGYDWPPSGNATARPWSVIEEIARQQGSTVSFIERNANGPVGESTFSYRTSAGRREVWYMTAVGLANKIQTVQTMDLAGIAIWQLGYENPDYWETVRENMVEDPTLVQRAINPLLPDH